LARLPICKLLAPAVPDCAEVVKPGRSCQHSSADRPSCADSAVMLRKEQKVSIEDKAGVLAYANALEIIPRTLAQNSGFDAYSVIESLRAETDEKRKLGVDLETGKLFLPEKNGVFDNYTVKKQFLTLGTMIAVKLLLVDEVLSAGRKMGGKPQE